MGNIKLGMILENKVVQKLKLEKNVFYKKSSPKLIFLNENFFRKNLFLYVFSLKIERNSKFKLGEAAGESVAGIDGRVC